MSTSSLKEKIASLKAKAAAKKSSNQGSAATVTHSGPYIIVGVPTTEPGATDESCTWRTFPAPQVDHTNTSRLSVRTSSTNDVHFTAQSAYPALGAHSVVIEFHQHILPTATEHAANINVAKDAAVLAHLKVGTSKVIATNTTGATTAASHLPANGTTRAYDGTALLFERPTLPPTTESPITLPGIVVVTRGILDESAERTIVPRRLAHPEARCITRVGAPTSASSAAAPTPKAEDERRKTTANSANNANSTKKYLNSAQRLKPSYYVARQYNYSSPPQPLGRRKPSPQPSLKTRTSSTKSRLSIPPEKSSLSTS